MRGLKYRGYTALAPLLGQAMVAPASVLVGRSVPLLVPVPLSAGRRRERGFNQAAVLARALGAASGWAVGELLARPAGGPALARRRRREREALAPHAYALRRPIPDLSLGPPILIVDDVITTGSTVAACVALLRDTGARCVGAVSFTRTVVAPEPG